MLVFIHDPEDMQRAGHLILKEFGPQSVVIKGGHLEGGAKDFLFTKDDQFVWEVHEFKPVIHMVQDVPLLQ